MTLKQAEYYALKMYTESEVEEFTDEELLEIGEDIKGEIDWYKTRV